MCVHCTVHNCRTQYCIEHNLPFTLQTIIHHCSDDVYWRDRGRTNHVHKLYKRSRACANRNAKNDTCTSYTRTSNNYNVAARCYYICKLMDGGYSEQLGSVEQQRGNVNPAPATWTAHQPVLGIHDQH